MCPFFKVIYHTGVTDQKASECSNLKSVKYILRTFYLLLVENINCKIETQTERTNMDTKGEREGGMNWEIEMDTY